jgi:hypothetical protein
VKPRFHRSGLAAIALPLVCAIALGLPTTATHAAGKGSDNPRVFASDSTPYGRTMSDWLRYTYATATLFQVDDPCVQSGPVWVLSACEDVLSGKAIAIYEGWAGVKGVTLPETATDVELIAQAEEAADLISVPELLVSVDGVPVNDPGQFRQTSDGVYPVLDPSLSSEPLPTTLDMYLFLLKPLPVGPHQIEYAMVVRAPDGTVLFQLHNTQSIRVVPHAGTP